MANANRIIQANADEANVAIAREICAAVVAEMAKRDASSSDPFVIRFYECMKGSEAGLGAYYGKPNYRHALRWKRFDRLLSEGKSKAEAAIEVVAKAKRTEEGMKRYFDPLIALGLADCTLDHLVVEFPSMFSAEIVARAKATLAAR
jgi:hypothetical protein